MRLLRGDCLERMKDIPDESVDMVLCDPPYGITQAKWDSVIPLPEMWAELKRIAKPAAAIVLFCQMPFTAELVCSNEKDFRYMWVWNMHYRRNFLNAKKQPLRQTENIAVFYKKQCKYYPRMRKGAMRVKGTSSKQRGGYGHYTATRCRNDQYYPTDILDFIGVPANELLHQNQKPVPLLKYLVETYTDPGDIVLDFAMGSGSTGVACIEAGRDFIGIELDDEYFGIAKRRIENAKENGNDKERST